MIVVQKKDEGRCFDLVDIQTLLETSDKDYVLFGSTRRRSL
jgi:hypothetical protein